MARVTAYEVKEILDSCDTEDSIVETIIGAANRFINKVFINDSTLEETDLKEIERWLSAHLISVSLHRQTQQEKLGDGLAIFAGKYGEGLSMTSYGQTVLLLDTTGKIANYGKRRASIYAVPKRT